MNRIDLKVLFLTLLTAAFMLSGCDDSDNNGSGTLKVTLWGEEFIETGIPAEEFADGYAINYHKFLVNIKDIKVAQSGDHPDNDEMFELPASKIWDVTKKGPTLLGKKELSAGEYNHTSYKVTQASKDSIAGNASKKDVDFMKKNGYSMYVEADATDGKISKHFAWGFKYNALYDPCKSTGSVKDGKEATVQVTIHGDHLFYNSAVSHEPDLMFTEIAKADGDDDGEVTQAELEGYAIKTLPDYVVPPDRGDIDNMWEYISFMATTTGHIDGEGGCEIKRN